MDEILHALSSIRDARASEADARARAAYARLDADVHALTMRHNAFVNDARLFASAFANAHKVLADADASADLHEPCLTCVANVSDVPLVFQHESCLDPADCAITGSSTYVCAYVNTLCITLGTECEWIRDADVEVKVTAPAPVTSMLTRIDATQLKWELCYSVDAPYNADIEFSAHVRGTRVAQYTVKFAPGMYVFKNVHQSTHMVPDDIRFNKACRFCVDVDNSTLAVTTRMLASYDCALFETDLNLKLMHKITVDRASFGGCVWTPAHTLLVCDAGNDALHEIARDGSVLREMTVRHPSCVAQHAGNNLIAVGCMASPQLLHVYTYPSLELLYSTADRVSQHVYVALSAVAFTPDGAYVTGIDHAHALHVFDARNGSRLQVVPILTTNTVSCMCTGFATDEVLVLVQSANARNAVISVQVTSTALLLDDDAHLRAAVCLSNDSMPDVVALASTPTRLFVLTRYGLMAWA